MQKASWWERMRKKKQNKTEHFEEQRFGINGHFAKIWKGKLLPWYSSFILDAKINFREIWFLIIFWGYFSIYHLYDKQAKRKNNFMFLWKEDKKNIFNCSFFIYYFFLLFIF